ncbi:MAG: hypothetical protein WD579_00515 [Candidatus Paceibacterota bacterium]
MTQLLSWLTKDWTIGQLNALVKKIGEENARRILSDEIQFQLVEPEKPRILEFFSTTTARGAKEFIAKDNFREGKETDGVSIIWLGSNFKSHFLGKIEENVEDTELKIHRLREYSRDIPIIHELGGEEIVETSLSHLWSLLKRQGQGEDGDLLTNGYANIFYIRDSQGVLWAVRALWFSGRRGWYVEAYSIEYPSRWDGGYQVFSRDSVA